MSRTIKNVVSGIYFLAALLVCAGCANQNGKAAKEADGTMVFALKSKPDFRPHISFCREYDETTGFPIWSDTVFTLDKKGWLNAVIELNRFQNELDESMFHVDWVGPDGKSMFMKRIDVDSSGFIQSSISISPGRREPGNYILKLYWFRALIASKRFILLPANSINPSLASRILPKISFCSKTANTGECLQADSVFTIRNKSWVKAVVNISGESALSHEETQYQLEWIGWDGKAFYSKTIGVVPGKPTNILSSSVSIPPGKREPGLYELKVYCFGELISSGRFRLILPE